MLGRLFILYFTLMRKLERAAKRLIRPFIMYRLEKINKKSSRPIIGNAKVAISLTTYGLRTESVFYTIESIAKGCIKPCRITLRLDESTKHKSLPSSLERLKARGLSIEYVEDLGPHKKYFFEVQDPSFDDIPFVTADDDTLYPNYWLKKLLSIHDEFPDQILCYRAHEISFNPDGQLLPYQNWGACRNSSPNKLHFSTGSCGVLFPSRMRKALRQAGKGFLNKCPRADDIWLNLIALRYDLPVRQVVRVSKRFYEIPGTRSGALSEYNNGQGGNDIQLKLSYTDLDLKKLQ